MLTLALVLWIGTAVVFGITRRHANRISDLNGVTVAYTQRRVTGRKCHRFKAAFAFGADAAAAAAAAKRITAGFGVIKRTETVKPNHGPVERWRRRQAESESLPPSLENSATIAAMAATMAAAAAASATASVADSAAVAALDFLPRNKQNSRCPYVPSVAIFAKISLRRRRQRRRCRRWTVVGEKRKEKRARRVSLVCSWFTDLPLAVNRWP